MKADFTNRELDFIVRMTVFGVFILWCLVIYIMLRLNKKTALRVSEIENNYRLSYTERTKPRDDFERRKNIHNCNMFFWLLAHLPFLAQGGAVIEYFSFDIGVLFIGYLFFFNAFVGFRRD